MKKTILLMISCAVLCACVSPSVISRAKSVYAPEFVYHQKTFVLEPTSPQKESLAYPKYVRDIAAKLEQYGLIQTQDASAADYAVHIDYGVQKALAEQTAEEPVSAAADAASEELKLDDGFVYPGGVFRRFFMVEMTDMKRTDPARSVVFSAQVESEGTESDLAVVSRCLINALFKDFPAKSGVLYKTRVRYASCAEE